MYLPLVVVVVNSFNASRVADLAADRASPSSGGGARASSDGRPRRRPRPASRSRWPSTAVALVLGTLMSLALQRYRFFGKSSVNLLVILPIALPGIVTGIALNNAFRGILGLQLSLLTVIVAHATFCIVTVFNNVQARLRRMGGSFEEASADLGAGVWTTFRLVTFPQLRSALLAGGLLAFALSFDEIIVTTFTAGAGATTLPIWILDNLFRPNQAPVVNVVAVVLILLSVVPIWLAQKLCGDTDALR